MKASVLTLGCKVNQNESDLIMAGLKAKGYEVSSKLEHADIYIINTCAITSEAERKSRQMITRAKKHNPIAKVFVVGCASELNPKYFMREEVTYILGAHSKERILDYLSDKGITIFDKEIAIREANNLPLVTRTRAYIKIQDGCDRRCSYCIIPSIRGKSRSRSIAQIVNEVEQYAKRVKEVVIIGINISLYGKDIGVSLQDLINAISHINVRVRLGSFYVEAITQELLQALKNLPNFCHHFHLSLQSGDDKILSDMNRSYDSAECYQKIKLIRSFFPNAGITSDIIVGYPTETEELFNNTLDFIQKAKINDVHSFIFSPRQGTKAAELQLIPQKICKDRQRRLAIVSEENKKEFLLNNINVYQQVLFEEKLEDNFVGYSKNYIRVYSENNNENVLPKSLYQDGLKS